MKHLIAIAAALSLSGCIVMPEPIKPAPVAYQAPVQKQSVVKPKPAAAKPAAVKPIKPPAPFGPPTIPGRIPDENDGSAGGSDWGG